MRNDCGVCVCVCGVVCGWLCGVVVVSLAQGLRSHSSTPTLPIFHLLQFSICFPSVHPDWGPGICWGAYSRLFLMKHQWSRCDFRYPHHLLWWKAFLLWVPSRAPRILLAWLTVLAYHIASKIICICLRVCVCVYVCVYVCMHVCMCEL